MPDAEPLRKLGFLTIGRFDEADPGPGHEETLQMIERAEALGFDSVWLRCRHLQPGISSPSRSWLRPASAPVASSWARPSSRWAWRIRSGWPRTSRPSTSCRAAGSIPGVSVGTPMLYDHYKTALYPETHELEDFSKDRVLRLLECLRGEPVSDFEGTVGIEEFTGASSHIRRAWPTGSGTAAACRRRSGRAGRASTT